MAIGCGSNRRTSRSSCRRCVRLTQAFVNLLNNAAKYTGDGGDIWLESGHRPTAKFTSRATTAEAFDPDASNAYSICSCRSIRMPHALGGLGVGLALVRRIVELHGGNVQAHSDGIGKGSEFVIRMPAHRGVCTWWRPRMPAELPPLRVLVVDDSRDAADSFAC